MGGDPVQVLRRAPHAEQGATSISSSGAPNNRFFGLRWIVATCRWGPSAERAIRNAPSARRQVDFRSTFHVQVMERDAKRPVQEPWPLQGGAIEGLTNHDRGRPAGSVDLRMDVKASMPLHRLTVKGTRSRAQRLSSA